MIVVGLVFIIMYVSVVIIVFATWVVATAIETLFVFWGVVPCMVGFFRSVPSDEFHHCLVIEITTLQEITVEFGRSAVQITLCSYVWQAALQSPMVVNQACSKAYGFAMAVITAGAEVYTNKRIDTYIFGLHIDSATKCTGTVGRRSYATLYLDALKRWREVCHVHPKRSAAFGIAYRNAVGCDVDTWRIGTTNTKRGVPDAVSSVRSSGDRRCKCQYIRKVKSKVNLLDVLLWQRTERHRRFVVSACWHYLHTL